MYIIRTNGYGSENQPQTIINFDNCQGITLSKDTSSTAIRGSDIQCRIIGINTSITDEQRGTIEEVPVIAECMTTDEAGLFISRFLDALHSEAQYFYADDEFERVEQEIHAKKKAAKE